MTDFDSSTDSFCIQARAYLSARNFLKVRDVAAKIIREAPDDYLGYLYAGQARLGLGDAARAVEFLRKALEREPDSDFIHYVLATGYREMKKAALAEKHCLKAIELDPADADYWFELGCICHEQKDRAGVRRAAKKALELDPENPTAHNLLGMAAAEGAADRHEKSIEAYSRALEADAEDPYAYNNLAVEYLRVGAYGEAETFLREALRLAPEESLFRQNLYLVLRHRSTVYRLLTWPSDALGKVIEFVGDHWWTLFVLLWLPAYAFRKATGSPWLHSAVVLLVPVALWVVWWITFWPLLKVYEWLTISDIMTEAREVGARHGGFLGLHEWPRWVRFLLFFLAMCGLWTGLGFAVDRTLRAWMIGIVVGGVAAVVILGWVVYAREKRALKQAADRAWKMRKLG